MGRTLKMNAMEPTQFGWQRVGEIDFYLPSPESIRNECEKIQRSWTPSERYKRRTAMPGDPPNLARGRNRVELPVCRVATLQNMI
jgi:hypothetical protein